MVSDELKEMQGCILGILKEIDKACREHGVRYFLSDGTMLGAVRHKGFIPWDDDADISMPRPDYDKLIANVRNWLPEHFDVVTGLIDPKYPYPFARIYDKRTTYLPRRGFNFYSGVPVDIFPLDGMIEDCPERDKHIRKYKKLIKRLYIATVDPKAKSGFSRLYYTIMQSFTDAAKIHKELDALQRKYDYDSSPLICNHWCSHRKVVAKYIYPKKFFSAPVDVQFEDAVLMGMPEPDEYLTIWYGDYMTPPPPKDRPLPNYRIMDVHKSFLDRNNK